MSEKNMMLPLSKLTKEELKWLSFWGNREPERTEPINILALRRRKEVQEVLEWWSFRAKNQERQRTLRAKILEVIKSCA